MTRNLVTVNQSHTMAIHFESLKFFLTSMHQKFRGSCPYPSEYSIIQLFEERIHYSRLKGYVIFIN